MQIAEHRFVPVKKIVWNKGFWNSSFCQSQYVDCEMLVASSESWFTENIGDSAKLFTFLISNISGWSPILVMLWL